MIDIEKFFTEYKDMSGLWCPAITDVGDLAKCMDTVVANDFSIISVVPSAVETVWPWLEARDIKIMARFYIADKKISEQSVSDITKEIKECFSCGAHGAQVFLPLGALPDLVEMTHLIKNDLFFDRDLIIGMNISEIKPLDWDGVFENLRKVNVSALMLALPKDTGNKSNFVGKIYGMLDKWHDDNNFDIHFLLGANFMRIEQTVRLIKCMRPELMGRIKFFVGY